MSPLRRSAASLVATLLGARALQLVYAVEELDGIIYQLLPHAANSNPVFARGFATNAQDYDTAHMEDNSGYLRVNVSPDEVLVQYVRSMLPGAGANGIVQHEYVVPIGGLAVLP